MEIMTFQQDLLGLSEFAKRLELFIGTEHAYVDGGLVLALTSKFGSGKTTFLQMWKSSLESKEAEAERALVISLNAWESDYFGDPLFAIISALAERLETGGRSATPLVNAARDLGWFAAAIGGQVVQKVTGVDIVAAGDLAEKKRHERQDAKSPLLDTFSIYQGRKASMESLREAIREFVAALEPKVFFLVDELDRCRPDYAISYLETIKHIFDIKGAVFILAADRQQLENSARTAFGPNLDFEEYYRKFIHREIALPPITDEGYNRLASEYVTRYLEREESRICFMTLDRHRIDNIVELVAALRLTPRQIQEVFRILGHMFATWTENRGRLRWCIAVGSIAMAALKIGRPREFYLLGSQMLEAEEAADFLKRLLGDTNYEWWFTLFLTGGGLRAIEENGVKAIMVRVGLAKEEDNMDMRMELAQWYQGWGYSSSNRFNEIYDKIEQIAQWS